MAEKAQNNKWFAGITNLISKVIYINRLRITPIAT